MENKPYSVYVRLGPGDRIEAIGSDAFLKSTEGWTKIDEGYGDRFHHAQWHYIPGSPKDERYVCLYKLVDNQIVPRTQEEMDADWEAIKIETTDRLFIRTKNGDVAYLTTPEEMEEDPLDAVHLFLEANDGSVGYLTTPTLLEVNPLTATAKQDVRLGTTAVTAEGIVTGEKNFPSYETLTGTKVIMPGTELELPLSKKDAYDFTELQAIICQYNTTVDDSFAADKVCIGDTIYPVSSTNPLSIVTKSNDDKTIKFGLTNESDKPIVIRYFTYREVG